MAEAAARNHAIEETESACTLRRVKSLVEGVEIDDSGTNRKLQDVQKKSVRLERANQALREEKSQAIARANRSNKIATDLLAQNRNLTTKVTVLEDDKLCKKCKDAGKKKCECKELEESHAPKGSTLTEGLHHLPPRRRPLDADRRKPGKTRSTRPTLTESQVRTTTSTSDPIGNIARQMSEDSSPRTRTCWRSPPRMWR